MKKRIENQKLLQNRRLLLIAVDTLLIAAVYGATALLLNIGIESIRVSGAFSAVKFLLLLGCFLMTRAFLGLYKTIWRYANVTTCMKLVAADAVGGLIFLGIGRVFPKLGLGFSCTVIVTMGVIIVTLCSRFLYQLLYASWGIRGDLSQLQRERNSRKTGKASDSASRTGAVGRLWGADPGLSGQIHKIDIAIVGAGNVGASLADELIRNPRSHYAPYCFIDRDPQKVGCYINGLPVFPGDENVVKLIKTLPVKEIVVALPDADPEEKKELYNLYRKTDCKVKIYDYPVGDEELPSLKKGQFREFKIEDLLFRDSLTVKGEKAKKFYTGKTVLVTGGGGSIGSELCRQIAQLHPRQLVIVDIYENNAYEIQQELVRKYGDKLNLRVYIGSVRDEKRMDEIFRAVRPELVFHAAAHKHVPLMEESGCEAIKNNVFGTYNVANLAEKYGAEKFLLISTDKAVNPTNIMGASKRLCEMVIQCRADSKTEFTAVRFGNVLGSNGSVIPLFRQQIEAGGPVTLTDKRIIRYFMTIPEAVGLVMETGAMARGGELFVLNMGKPIKILELAENMIRMSGLRPYEDIDIVEVGLRPGEKLYEELLMKSEELDKTENDMIFIERDKGATRHQMEEKLEILRAAVEQEGRAAVLRAIRRTVPTYHNPDEVNNRAAEAEEMLLAL